MQTLKLSRGWMRRPTTVTVERASCGEFRLTAASPKGTLTREEIAQIDALAKRLQAQL